VSKKPEKMMGENLCFRTIIAKQYFDFSRYDDDAPAIDEDAL